MHCFHEYVGPGPLFGSPKCDSFCSMGSQLPKVENHCFKMSKLFLYSFSFHRIRVFLFRYSRPDSISRVTRSISFPRESHSNSRRISINVIPASQRTSRGDGGSVTHSLDDDRDNENVEIIDMNQFHHINNIFNLNTLNYEMDESKEK